jgi:hypothetical protein
MRLEKENHIQSSVQELHWTQNSSSNVFPSLWSTILVLSHPVNIKIINTLMWSRRAKSQIFNIWVSWYAKVEDTVVRTKKVEDIHFQFTEVSWSIKKWDGTVKKWDGDGEVQTAPLLWIKKQESLLIYQKLRSIVNQSWGCFGYCWVGQEQTEILEGWLPVFPFLVVWFSLFCSFLLT